MTTDLSLNAGVQLDHWRGSVAADSVDFHKTEELLGIDMDQWRLIRLEISIYAGHQFISGWGVPSDVFGEDHMRESNASGILELTKIVHFEQWLEGHSDTNPPSPPAVPVTWATDLLGRGFKRFQLVIYRDPYKANPELRIKEVGSITDVE